MNSRITAEIHLFVILYWSRIVLAFALKQLYFAARIWFTPVNQSPLFFCGGLYKTAFFFFGCTYE